MTPAHWGRGAATAPMSGADPAKAAPRHVAISVAMSGARRLKRVLGVEIEAARAVVGNSISSNAVSRGADRTVIATGWSSISFLRIRPRRLCARARALLWRSGAAGNARRRFHHPDRI